MAGATGLVGRAVVAALLADKTYQAIHTLGRRSLPTQHARLTQHTVDLAALPALSTLSGAVDHVYIALGTTIKIAGSQDAFKAVDLDAVVAVARAARAAGATRLGVVSAMGASAQSMVFYNRIKGQMEEAVSALGFDTVVIARPSLIDGDRDALGQPGRSGESLAMLTMRLWRPLIPANYKSVSPEKIARALVANVKAGQPGRQVLLSGALQTY